MNINIFIKGKGRPVVFFHGWGFDHQIWLQLASHIDDQYQLFLVDLPGFGLSSAMPWEQFKLNLLRQLPDCFALVGWSMGGLFASRLAIEEPQRVSTLINVAASPRFIKAKGWPGIDSLVFKQFFSKLVAEPQLTISQFVSLQLKGQKHNYQNAQVPTQASLQEGLQVLEQWDLREPLHFFAKPAYFMFGYFDAIMPRTTMAVMQKIYPKFDYVMFNKAAHMPFLSDQEEFINVLRHIYP